MTALDSFGSGCAAFDMDNDGWQDVLLIGSPAPGLFRNLGDARSLAHFRSHALAHFFCFEKNQ